MRRFVYIALILTGGILLSSAGSLVAQEYPAKPIRIIVPTSAGLVVDISARLIAPEMAKSLGQPILVENKPGAGMLLGFEYVAKQVPADGYTLLLSSMVDLAVLPIVTKDLRFDPLKDLVPIIDVCEASLVLVSSSSLPWKSFNEMVAYAKNNPGKLNYGASTPSNRLTTLAIVQSLGVDAVYIPYNAGGPYVQGLLAGDAHIGFLSEVTAIGSGSKINTLAVAGPKRRSALPDVPTFVELGHPRVMGTLTFSLDAPTATPRTIIERLNGVVSKTLQDPAVRAGFSKIMYDPVGGTADAAAKKRVETVRAYSEVASKAGIRQQ